MYNVIEDRLYLRKWNHDTLKNGSSNSHKHLLKLRSIIFIYSCYFFTSYYNYRAVGLVTYFQLIMFQIFEKAIAGNLVYHQNRKYNEHDI